MNHYASPSFWSAYRALPSNIRDLADRNYDILKVNPAYPSLHFKKVSSYWSVRVGIHYRALSVEVDDGFLWFWIGSHTEYDRRIKP